MKKLLIFSVLILLAMSMSSDSFFWGQIGHRTIGHIADERISKKARKQVERVLGNENLAEVSTWMDEVRSDNAYDYAETWHYCTIPDGMTYEEAPEQEGGDVIKAIETIIAELKTGGLSAEEEATKLKFLVHLVGDIHQPLHVGNGNDRGGNDVKVNYFGSNTNLHSVWDSRIIDGKQMSFTEFAHWINHPTQAQIKEWQSASVRDWAYESMSYRDQVYDVPEDGRISYEYGYKYFDIIKLRVLQAGIRLAGVINDIYG